MLLRKTLLEEDLARLEHRSKYVIKQARESQNPKEYIAILDGIQFEVNFILAELKKYDNK